MLWRMLQLFAGRSPFAGKNNLEVKRLVLEGKKLDPPKLLVSQGSTWSDLFHNCLTENVSRRLTMEKVVAKLS